jgi:hypothetical protein
MLAQQVVESERFGVWCLAQALAEYHLMTQNPLEDDSYHNHRMSRLLTMSGAALGSINSRTTAFRFLEEVRNGQHPGGDAEAYRSA